MRAFFVVDRAKQRVVDAFLDLVGKRALAREAEQLQALNEAIDKFM
jgi:hypothetical protein